MPRLRAPVTSFGTRMCTSPGTTSSGTTPSNHVPVHSLPGVNLFSVRMNSTFVFSTVAGSIVDGSYTVASTVHESPFITFTRASRSSSRVGLAPTGPIGFTNAILSPSRASFRSCQEGPASPVSTHFRTS